MKTFQINTVFLKNPKCLFTPLTWHFKTTYIGSSAECLDKRFCDIGWLPLALNEFIKTTDTRGGKYISLMKIKTANEFYFSQHSKNSMFVISYTMQVLGWKLGRLGGIRRPFCNPISITIFIPLGSSATARQQVLALGSINQVYTWPSHWSRWEWGFSRLAANSLLSALSLLTPKGEKRPSSRFFSS